MNNTALVFVVMIALLLVGWNEEVHLPLGFDSTLAR